MVQFNDRALEFNCLAARLRLTQYDPKDQERKEHTLCRVHDDGHPGAAVAPGGKC